MQRFLITLALLLLAGTARAEISCTTSIAGNAVTLSYSEQDPIRALSSQRERMFTKRSTCLGFVALRYLAPDLTEAEQASRCLLYDPKAHTIVGVATGARDAYQHCRTPGRFCRFVARARGAATGTADAALGLADRSAQVAQDSGLTAVARGPGAVLLSGNAGYVAGALGSAATSAASIAAAPAVLVGTGIAVVSVGGALLYCAG